MGYEALCHMVSQLTAKMAERLLDAELAAGLLSWAGSHRWSGQLFAFPLVTTGSA